MMINLFDSNFLHDKFSTAYQTSKYIQYVKQQRTFDGVTLFTDEWINNPIVDEVKSKYKVAWLHEPYCLHVPTYERAETNFHKFDLVLTYHSDFLDRYPDKCRYCPYAGTWINPADWGIRQKSKLCSMLIGSKMATEGHRARHEWAAMIETEGFDVDFYGAKGLPVGYGQQTKYVILQDYAFSIAGETCYEEGLFTEWLLDCFALGTIPIFWGAPDIHLFFDTDGILQFDTTDRLFKVLANKVNFGEYRRRLDSVRRNLERLPEYAVTEDWMYENVLRGLE